ncbi:MAG: cytochrome c [Proteobacteria bacterium]|nr:cytochrome c [Pseudomonadota bacterium]
MKPLSAKLLGIFSAAALTVLLFFLFSKEPARLEARAESERGQSIEIGAGLYELHCRTCHGIRGEGVGQLGPALGDQFFFTERLKEVGWQDTLESYVFASSSHGRIVATRPKYAGSSSIAVMNPWLDKYGGPLRRDELVNITHFILNWRATAMGEVELTPLKIAQTSLDDPETISKGKKVFLHNCKECHSIEGINQAGSKGPDLSKIGLVASTRVPDLTPELYIKESFLIPTEYIVKGFEPEVLGYKCGGILTRQQLDEVVAFLLTMK